MPVDIGRFGLSLHVEINGQIITTATQVNSFKLWYFFFEGEALILSGPLSNAIEDRTFCQNVVILSI
jgi:hypothetical protein